MHFDVPAGSVRDAASERTRDSALDSEGPTHMLPKPRYRLPKTDTYIFVGGCANRTISVSVRGVFGSCSPRRCGGRVLPALLADSLHPPSGCLAAEAKQRRPYTRVVAYGGFLLPNSLLSCT